ncbi:MAG: AbrB/MazE/SpoVT family DNA-binding domain-containing protein [Propionibacteriaceae bacterium]|jgi:AbrB family looped-hinge helix DNA binding protein|nr:AbrB/MazE/SpoVT family DNA-binding domain-containing protein [Propionibacteriaceae bacterium]
MTMMYATVSTKGQVTIPAPIREELGIEPGRRIGFSLSEGEILVSVPPAIETVRHMLQQELRAQGTLGVPYTSGDGWTEAVQESHGQS